MKREIALKRKGKSPIYELRQTRVKSLELGEVKVKVHYSGMNFADIMMGLGLYPDAPPVPFVPGYEFCGEVIETSVNSVFSNGDMVIGGTAFGGYSDTINIPEWQLGHLPQMLTPKEGAGLLVSFLTCLFAFRDLARVRSTDRVAIDCGSGALGAVSINYLKSLGVEDIVGITSRVEKLPVIESRGAKALTLTDYSREEVCGFDVILNSRGGNTIEIDRKKLAPLGRIVCIGASHFVSKGRLSYLNVISQFLGMKKIDPIALMNENKGVMGLNVLRLFEQPELLKGAMVELENLAKTNLLPKPIIDKIFKAEEVSQAIHFLGSGESKGKVLLDWT